MNTIIVKRVDSGTADTSEIRDPARAAGYSVVGELTQSRRADAALQIGEGKAEELAELVAESDATTVIFDNRLGPYQMYNLGNSCPTASRSSTDSR